MRRLEAAMRVSSRPVLHGAVHIVQELGKSRASAMAIRGYNVDDVVQQEDRINSTADINKGDDEAGDSSCRSMEGEEYWSMLPIRKPCFAAVCFSCHARQANQRLIRKKSRRKKAHAKCECSQLLLHQSHLGQAVSTTDEGRKMKMKMKNEVERTFLVASTDL